MSWQTSTINPAVTSPAVDINKITNDLQVLRDTFAGNTDPDVPVSASALGAVTLTGDQTIAGNKTFTGNTSYTGTLTGGTGVINIGSGQLYKDASGNVGIGTSSPVGRLHVETTGTGTNAGDNVVTTLRSQAAGRAVTLQLSDGSTASYIGQVGGSNIAFGTNNTERARIDSSGNLLVGTTSFATPGFAVHPSGYFFLGNNAQASGWAFATFQRSGTTVGTITQNGTTAVSYNTSSDYRLKHDIQPMTGALAKVAQLKPVTYKWNADDSQSQGFIAHELQEVVPECVTGEKDAVDAEGNPQYQGIDTSFLVATLTAALQEAHGLIKDLQARIEALEGTPEE
jgi:hypothetical protein